MKKLYSLFTALLFVGTMWGETLTCTFEQVEGKSFPYNDAWVLTSGTESTAYHHGGSRCVTLNTNSFNLVTANKIEGTVTNVTYYAGRTSKNTTETNVYIQTSTDGKTWTTQNTFLISAAARADDGNWDEVSQDMNINNCYVRVTRNNAGTSTAVRAIDDVIITYTPAADVTNLSIKAAPTKLNYKVGEELDLTGLVLTADDKDVTSGYTASPANGAILNSVGAQTVAITYGGKTVNQTIHVGELTGIEITTPPTKTVYNEGQTFDPEGMVVKATFSDQETTPTEWTETVDDYTYSPATALQPENTSVTVSYEWATVEKTANQDITVNAATAYTVTFDAGTGSCATASLTEPTGLAGVELPTATIAITGWSFAGWAEASATNTEVEPTLYAAGTTYHPVENCTLYAVYKFSSTSTTQFVQATSLFDITNASAVVIVNSGKVLDNTLNAYVNAPTIIDGIMEPADKDIFTLSGNNTDGFTLTNGTKRLGAVSSSQVILSSDASNDLWSFAKIGETTNFQVLSNSISGQALQRYNSGGYTWKTYTTNTTAIYQMQVYVPNTVTVYNSNPATMINPTVAFTTAGDKNLYVKDEESYTNAANVTGIAKSPVYSSSDETVATVSEAGVVTALKAGEAIITAKVAEEIGVNTEAKATYNVTVKDAKTITGLKAITDASGVKSFTADLTDAVVTYVNGNYAYIQDASGAVYASCGSNLTAGTKINGTVSGSIKASYKIDEITAINLDDATVTEDGVIPAALTKTVAELIASTTTLEGQLVQVSGATVTTSHASGSASGGKISDDEGISSINLYAPKSNIAVLQQAQGTFQGYISYYNATSYRLNIYDPSQITITRNAPTDQELAFESNAVVLDHPTAEYDAFVGQTVSGAQTTPVYSIEEGDDEDGVVTSINSETGAIVLSGNEGTATITVTAPAGEIVEAGVTTPWNEATKTYTITVRQLYDVNLVIKVDGEEVAYGNQATLAGGTDPVSKLAGTQLALTATRTTGYQFVKWTTSSTNIEIAAADSTKTSGLKATVQGAGTIYANFTAVPELLVSATALNLGYAKLNAPLDAKTFTISGASLEEGNLTLTLDEAIKDAFTVTPNPVAVNGTLAETVITVTPVTTTAGDYSGNLTISGGGLDPVKTVALSSIIEQTYTVTWSVNGVETSQTDIANTTLTPPATGTLAGKVFVGWAEAAIDGQTDVEPTFINITKMPAEEKELFAVYASGNPAVEESETISLTSSQEDWVGTGTEKYFSEPYGMKTLNAKIVNKSIADFENYANTAGEISIGFKCLQNGGTGSRLTISLVDEDGNAIAGTAKEVTPVNTNDKANMTYKDVTYSSSEVQGKNATGYMVQCTTFDKAILVNGTRYTITIASTLHAYITNAYAVTFDAPENGTLTVKNGENVITSGDMFPKGTLLTITVTPESADYKVTGVRVNGNVFDLNYNPYVLQDQDITISATVAEKAEPAFSWSDTEATYILSKGEENALPTLDNADSFDLTFESTNESVATIDEEGNVYPKAVGTTEIKAVFAGDATYKAKTASYTLTVKTDVPTGIGNGEKVDGEWTKVLRNGQIYILRGGKTYTIEGQLVR